MENQKELLVALKNGYRNSLIAIVVIVLLMAACGENHETEVKSPFSHLDTVKTKKPDETKDDDKKEGDGTTFSPFSNIEKK